MFNLIFLNRIGKVVLIQVTGITCTILTLPFYYVRARSVECTIPPLYVYNLILEVFLKKMNLRKGHVKILKRLSLSLSLSAEF